MGLFHWILSQSQKEQEGEESAGHGSGTILIIIKLFITLKSNYKPFVHSVGNNQCNTTQVTFETRHHRLSHQRRVYINMIIIFLSIHET
jgi:hypothetical protein